MKYRWQRVSLQRPCVVCAHTSYCLFDPVAGKALCTRKESNERCEPLHGWIHRVSPSPEEVDETQLLHSYVAHSLSDEEANERDQLYHEMARHPFMHLSPFDRHHLHDARGLDDATIARVGFFGYTDASGIDQVARDLERFARANELLLPFWHLPGVYAKDRPGARSGYVDCLMSVPHGALAIPVADVVGRWVAIQLRLRDTDMEGDGLRYIMLSSKRQGGMSSGSPTFIARPAAERYDRSRVAVTEGAFKGLALAEYYTCIVLALPGMDQRASVMPMLQMLRDRNEIDLDAECLLAFDQQPDNPRVAEARARLGDILSRNQRRVFVCEWSSQLGKGFDDAYQKDAEFTVHPFRTLSAATPKGEKAERGPSIAVQLVALADEAECFHDLDGEPWVTFPVDGHMETCSLRSGIFKDWLEYRLHKTTGRNANPQAMQEALGILRGRARFEGPAQSVFVRLAELDGAIYLDLADEARHAVKVTPWGWEVVQDTPVKFRRPKGMLALPVPVKHGKIADLRPYVNVSDEEWPLVVAFLVACFRAHGVGGHPVLAIGGEQGSGKSTLTRIIRQLIDPNRVPLRAEPKDKQNLAIAAKNSWLLAFDNLSNLSGWLSDALCRMSTGGGDTYRTLYENDEETLFDATRPQILTSIVDVASKSDLVDRTILLSPPRITEESRRDEGAFWPEFELARPGILGALADAVACALKNLPSTKEKNLPRMADFAKWVIAAEPALGWKSGTFIAAYRENRANANTLAIDASLVAQALLKFIQLDADPWEGTAQALLEALNKQEPQNEKRPGWPTTARGLSGAIKTVAPNLRAEGLEIPEKAKKTSKGNVWTLSRKSRPTQEEEGADEHPQHPQCPQQPKNSGSEPMDVDVVVSGDGTTSTPTSTPMSTHASPENIQESGGSGGSGRTVPPCSPRRQHESIERRLEQLRARGITGDAAVRQALIERGELPREA